MQKALWITLFLLIAIVAMAKAGGDPFPPPSRERRIFCRDSCGDIGTPCTRDCPRGFEFFETFEGSPDGDILKQCCREIL